MHDEDTPTYGSVYGGKERDWMTYVLVWVVDPITKWRYVKRKLLSEVKPTDERVKF